MTTYTDVFGGDTVPPSQAELNVVAITADATMYWPYEYSGAGISAADIVQISSDAARNITLPAANSAGRGAGFVVSNTGSYVLTALDGAGSTLTTIGAGVAKYFYVEVATSAAGTWKVITWGTGTSSADATTLAGSGLTVTSGKLSAGISVEEYSGSTAITSAHRNYLVVNTGGAVTFTLAEATTLGTGYSVTFRNSGSGTLTLATTSSQTIDDATTLDVAPGESVMIVRSGTAFYSFGQGREVTFAFTQLNKAVSTTTVTITSDESANKMLNFTSASALVPTGNVTVTLPSVASVYYVYNNLTTAYDIIFTTGSGTTTTVPQGQRGILFVDSVNVVSAQSPAATGAVQFVDGSAASPSISFSSLTDAGFYKGTNAVGVAVAGSSVGTFAATGWTGPVVNTPSGNLAAITVQGALNELQTEIDGLPTATETTAEIAAAVAAHEAEADPHPGYVTTAEAAAAYQPADAQLTTLAGITTQQASALASLSDFIGTLLNDGDEAAARATLGIVNSATVRHAMLGGPVDSSGYPAPGGATGGTSVVTTAISASAPLVIGFANGFGAQGEVNLFGISTSNLTWTGLSTNGTMYLYVDYNAGGLTTGSTTLAPVYQNGGAYSTTSGQATFNIAEMVMKVGDGAAANQTNRVFVGEVTVAGGVVTAITWYAYQGRYTGAWVNTLPGASTVVSANHNLGTIELWAEIELKCLTAEYGYAVGDIETGFSNWRSGIGSIGLNIRKKATSMASAVADGAWQGQNISTTGPVAFTAANWAYRFKARRGF